MRPVNVLEDAHAGAVVAVLGGGPSLPSDILTLPRDAVLVSVNAHATRIAACAYLVFCDHQVATDCRRSGVPTVSKKSNLPAYYWDHTHKTPLSIGFSSAYAAWFALYVGAAIVVLCGIDCYRGPRLYFHGGQTPGNPGANWPIEKHVSKWAQGFAQMPGADRIRAASGPLTEVFQKWQ